MADADPIAGLHSQLRSLAYDTAGLTPAAAPLVAALLGDLVKAADSCRAVNQQASDAGRTSQTLQYQVEVLHREVGRLTGENDRLHRDLLSEADARAAQQSQAQQRCKELEQRNADLQFGTQQALERAAAVERERDGLRAKVRDLLGFAQQHAGDEAELKALYSSINLSSPVQPRPAPAAAGKTSRGAVSLLKAADSRILALEDEVRRRGAECEAVQEQLRQAQDALTRRDGEVQRLSTRLERVPGVDELAQRCRTEANEAVILQLNQQVESLTAELVEVQRRAVDRRALEAAQQAQREAEARAAGLSLEREGVAREVEGMQATLVRLQREAAGEGAARQKLGRLRATLEGVRAEKALLEGQLTHAEAKVDELRDRLEQREAALRRAQGRCKQLEGVVAAEKQQHAKRRSRGPERESASLQPEALTQQLDDASTAQEGSSAAAVQDHEGEALRRRVHELGQQDQQVRPPASCSEGHQSEPVAASKPPGDASSTAGTGEKQAEQAGGRPAGTPEEQPAAGAAAVLQAHIDRLEFERTELRVKLDQSEQRVASLAAAAARQSSAAASGEPALQAHQQGSDDSAAAIVDSLRRQLQERMREVEELSALGVQADGTVQQYMAQLRSMAAELQAAEARHGDAEARLARGAEEVQRLELEGAELRGLLGVLDADRGSLQAELGRQAEAAAAQAGAMEQQVQATQQALAVAEAHVRAANTRLAEREQALQAQHAEAQAVVQQQEEMRAQHAALAEEYRAVTDDMTVLVRENQAISHQLSSAAAERQELAEQVKLLQERSRYNEQLAQARGREASELRTAHESLSHETQRLQQSLAELAGELQARDAELATRGQEVEGLLEAQRGAQDQIHMHIAGLQAYERRLDAANRAMQRGEEAAGGLDRERQALLEQLRASEQVCFKLRRAHEALQHQLLHAEGRVGMLEARLADAQSDSDALKQRVALEQSRVGELESLLAIARADQSRRDTAAAEADPERGAASLREQKRLLEEQVATLQRQVDGLVQRREAQDEELGQLRSRLAAEFEAGASYGGHAAEERGALLAQELLEAKLSCAELAAEVAAHRGEAAALAGERDSTAAALQAASAELAGVRELLLQRQAGQQHCGCKEAGPHPGLEPSETVAEVEPACDAEGRLGGRMTVDCLLDMPPDVDAERDRLAREQQDMWAGLAHLQGSTPSTSDSDGSGRESSAVGAGGKLQEQVQEEERRRRAAEAELAAERQLRQQAQHDFQELLQSVDMLQSAPSRSPVSSRGTPACAVGSAGNSPADASQQPSQPPVHQEQLQAAFSALESVAHRLCNISGDGGWAPQPAPLGARQDTDYTCRGFAGLATC